MEADAFQRAIQIADAFERESIPYAIGGALVVGIWGIPRGTVDVDVNVFVEPEELDPVLNILRQVGMTFDATRAPLRSGSSGAPWRGTVPIQEIRARPRDLLRHRAGCQCVTSERPRPRDARGTRPTPARDSRRPESASLSDSKFHFLATPGGVGQSSRNVLGLQIRIRLQDVLSSLPGRKQAHDGADRHTEAADARAPSHDGGVMRDSRQRVHARNCTT